MSPSLRMGNTQREYDCMRKEIDVVIKLLSYSGDVHGATILGKLQRKVLRCKSVPTFVF